MAKILIGNVVGPQGIQGIQGIQGETGPTGPQGPQGATGPAGTTNYNELTNKPTNVSAFTNDSGYITASVNNLANYTNNTSIATTIRGTKPLTATTKPTTLVVNTIYDLGEQTALSLDLPTGTLGDFVQVDFLSGTTATTLTITATGSALSDYDLIPEASSIYSLFFVWGRLDTTTYGWKFAYSENTRTVV